ncbi:cell adhesion molecule 4 [Biomphalaria glabrata]|nr:hypothetical protein BgiMline_019417 [Biomphalaria glabrata]
MKHISLSAKAQGVQCFNAQLTHITDDISVTCMTSKIYPPAYCTFNVGYKVSGNIYYSHVHYLDTVDYYQSNCTWTSALQNFQAGNYTIDVSFYPNVTNDTRFATNMSMSFKFTVPNLYLSKYCFNGSNIVNGYVRPGATAECICYLDSTGYPPAFLQWSNSSNIDLGNHLNNTAITLPIEPNNNLVTYSCSRVTQLQNGNGSTFYTVHYARGPTNCSVELKDVRTTIWKICKTMPIKLTISCQVDRDDAIPGIKARIFINSYYSDIFYSQFVNQVYRVENEINITNAGNYYIGCQVQNIIFSDVNATCSYSSILQVMAPPVTAPEIQIRSDTIECVNALENKLYTIECRALGGIPSVSSITVSCGNIEELTQFGNIFTSPVIFTRNMTGQNCTCTAQHIGCYENNISTLQTNVLYKSSVTHFIVSSPVIDNGKSAQIHCEADGNPAPNITLLKGGEIIAQTNSGYSLIFNKLITCKDAGNYVCQVNNGIDFNKEFNQITLLVRCPLQFNTDEKFKNFSFSQGETFLYNFTVYGYPEPDKFIVFKTKQDLNNVEVTKSSMESPYVTIKLRILSITSKDFDAYILVIYQNETQSLIFAFTIKEVSQQENHNYEVPTRNRNVYNNVEIDTTSQYANVNVKQDIMVSKDDSSIYCNTPSENMHSPV